MPAATKLWTRRPTATTWSPLPSGSAARDFWLVDEDHDSLDGATAALVLDVEGIPVVAAFTSQKHVSTYAQDQPELFADPQNIPAFLVAGRDVVLTMPAGGGIMIDPSTDDERYLPPELVDRIRAELRS